MADGITLNTGSGGDVVAADDIGGAKHQRVKVQFGDDGAATDASATAPFPVLSEKLSAINIVSGGISGISTIQKFGFNIDVDTGGFEDIWSYGGDYNWLTAATILELVSDDANDAAVGTGARTVQIWGLDSLYAEQSEIVTLDGLTPVDTAYTYIRLHRMRVLTAGTGGTAAGTITAQVDGAGAVVAEIPIPHNQTEMAIYTVPAGKTAYLFTIYGSATDSATKADVGIMLQAREFGGVFCTKFNLKLASDGTCALSREFAHPLEFPEKTDIMMRTLTTVNDTTVVGAFDLVLKDD